jgi:hypothetical protein
VIVGAILAIVATRWAFRSHTLFSWDSANFALAMERIDIGAHRPHPPGYLGYVFVARAIDVVVRNPNTALVVWNIVVTAIAGAIVITWARRAGAAIGRPALTAGAAAAIVVASPLLWYYGEIAEIYPSEMLAGLLVAWTAQRSIAGEPRAIYWCAVAIATAALFKVTSAMFMSPLALYAWTRVPARDRLRSALLMAGLAAGVAAIFLAVQPDWLDVVWTQFTNSTSETRVIGGGTGGLKTLNRNLRSIAEASASALGLANAIGLLVWIAIDRRLPAGLSRPVALLWVLPSLLFFLLIHIGRRGYVLPLLPLAILVLAGFYARRGGRVAAMLIAVQAAAGAAQFLWLQPPSRATTGGTALYRDKSVAQRLASDLSGLTAPTRYRIDESDRRLAEMQALVARVCPAGDPVFFSETDARRLTWYFPAATVVHTSDASIAFVGTAGAMRDLPPEGILLSSACPAIWIDDPDANDVLKPADAERAGDVGWLLAPGTWRVTHTGVAAR